MEVRQKRLVLTEFNANHPRFHDLCSRVVKWKSESGYQQFHVPVRSNLPHTQRYEPQSNPLQLRVSRLLQLALGLPPFVRPETLLLVPHQLLSTRQRRRVCQSEEGHIMHTETFGTTASVISKRHDILVCFARLEELGSSDGRAILRTDLQHGIE